jgi:flagellar hook-length control protein FliK
MEPIATLPESVVPANPSAPAAPASASPFQAALRDALQPADAAATADTSPVETLADRQPATAGGNELPVASDAASAETGAATRDGMLTSAVIPLPLSISPPAVEAATRSPLSCGPFDSAQDKPRLELVGGTAAASKQAMPSSIAHRPALAEAVSEALAGQAEGQSLGSPTPGAEPAARVADFERLAAPAIVSAPSVTTPLAAAVLTAGVTGAAAASPDAPPAATAQSTIPLPLDHPQWGGALGERVIWMVGEKISSAELAINPPELGPIEVRIKIENGEASVAFAATESRVREVVEAALPRLREMLAEAGVQLADASVSPHSHSRAQRHGQPDGGTFSAPDSSHGQDGAPVVLVRQGLLDLYA